MVPLFVCMTQSLLGNVAEAATTLAEGAAKFPEEPFLACQLLELEMQMSTPTPESMAAMSEKIKAMAKKYPNYPQAALNLALMQLQHGQVETGLANLKEAMALAGRAPDFLVRVYQIRESLALNAGAL